MNQPIMAGSFPGIRSAFHDMAASTLWPTPDHIQHLPKVIETERVPCAGLILE